MPRKLWRLASHAAGRALLPGQKEHERLPQLQLCAQRPARLTYPTHFYDPPLNVLAGTGDW